jgi:hypothetical protein
MPKRLLCPRRLTIEPLEERTVPSAFWGSFAGTAQHTGLAPVPSQPLNQVRWQTPVDLNPSYSGDELLIHYGSPLITHANTVIVPVKTGASDGFQIEAHSGATGALLWTEPTDYTLPASGWTPSYSPVLTTAGRLYFPGAGGTVFYIDKVDGAPTSPVRLAYYGLDKYNANPDTYNSTVTIDTPLTADSAGDIYFGVRVTGDNPTGLVSGIVRIDASGTGTWVSATSAASDPQIGEVPINCAPALSNDGATLYIAVRGATTQSYGYLLGLDSTTLATKYKVLLKDPRNNFANDATLLDISTASPVVGPDGDVYYGIMGNPFNGSRGFLTHFDATLTHAKTFGAFGWDSTPAVVPASMVPMYTGTSRYLLFEKYNNYVAGEVPDGADGVNRIALLDPNAGMVDPHPSANDLTVMKVVMSIPGPSPDASFNTNYQNAVREWCINTALVDPYTKSIVMPSEDGNLYRWDLRTCALSQVVTVNPGGLGEAYVPTLEGPDGTIYTISNAKLLAVGGLPAALSVVLTSSKPEEAVWGQAVTFTATVSAHSGPVPGGKVTFEDGTKVLATVPLDATGHASFKATGLSAGRHFITLVYGGDAKHAGGNTELVQAVLQTTRVGLVSSAKISAHGHKVTFTATVTAGGPTHNVPEGTVTFRDGNKVLATVVLNSLGQASNGKVTFTTSALTVGTHSITATFSGDTNFTAAVSPPLSQRVDGPRPGPRRKK